MTDSGPGSTPTSSSNGLWGRHADRILAASVVLWLAMATVVFCALEDWSWVDSFYFSAVAVTTVGFGDLAPTTDISKLFTVFYILGGISIVTLFLNERLKRHVQRVSQASDT